MSSSFISSLWHCCCGCWPCCNTPPDNSSNTITQAAQTALSHSTPPKPSNDIPAQEHPQPQTSSSLSTPPQASLPHQAESEPSFRDPNKNDDPRFPYDPFGRMEESMELNSGDIRASVYVEEFSDKDSDETPSNRELGRQSTRARSSLSSGQQKPRSMSPSAAAEETP